MRRIMFLLVATLIGLQAFAQTTISGTVTDVNGEPVPGANVRAKGYSDVGTITDLNGAYSLNVPTEATTLLVSFVGMKALEVEIAGQTKINISLENEDVGIDEVIITAYGTQKKGSISGAIEVVKSDRLDQVPSNSFEKMLQGNVSGLQVVSNSGQPGSASDVRIRGISSITAGNSPLYVIDGVPMISGTLSRIDDDHNLTSALSSINANDIESITVLKDASSAALYGSRAANGVILITTKSGKDGKTKFNFRSSFGLSSPTTNNFEVLNATEFSNLVKEGAINAGMTPEEALEYAGTDEVNTNWKNEAFKDDAIYQNYELQVNGGTKKTRFFISGQYVDKEGIAIGSYQERISARFNIDHEASDKLKLGLRFAPSYSKSGVPLTSSAYFISPVVGAYLSRPNVPARNSDGTAYFDEAGPTGGANFLGVDDWNDSEIKSLRLLGNSYMSYEIIPGLMAETKIGVDIADILEKYWNSMLNPGNTAEGKGRGTRNQTRQINWTWTNKLTYSKTFADVHNFDVLLAQELQSSTYTEISAAVEDFPNDNLRELASGATPVTADSRASDYSYESFFTRLGYNFQEKYYVTVSYRRDGSSRFGSSNKWANFWSIGGTWRFSEENFMSGISFIDNGKIRVSYGLVGNSAIGNYDWQGLYDYGYNYLGSPGSAPLQVENPDLTWETTADFNAGLDIDFLGRFRFSIEAYKRITTDLLLDVPISSTSGFTTALRNVGSMANQGAEWSLGADILMNEFKWSVDVKMTINRNEVLELYKHDDIIDGTKIRREGEAYQTFYLQRWAGVNPANGTALWFDEDGNVTDNYSEASREIVGNADPDFYGGFTNNFSYKGFSLSVFFSYNYGNKIFNNTSRITNSDGAFANFNQSRDQLNYWRKPGDISENPLRINGNPTQSNQQSTRWLEDGSYLRLKNLTFAYQLPQELVSKAKMSSVQVYFRGVNLWTMTNFKGFDPEQNIQGTHWFTYPNARTFTLGIDIGF